MINSKKRSAQVKLAKIRSFGINLYPIQNRSAERPVQLEVVQFEALLYFVTSITSVSLQSEHGILRDQKLTKFNSVILQFRAIDLR